MGYLYTVLTISSVYSSPIDLDDSTMGNIGSCRRDLLVVGAYGTDA